MKEQSEKQKMSQRKTKPSLVYQLGDKLKSGGCMLTLKGKRFRARGVWDGIALDNDFEPIKTQLQKPGTPANTPASGLKRVFAFSVKTGKLYLFSGVLEALRKKKPSTPKQDLERYRLELAKAKVDAASGIDPLLTLETAAQYCGRSRASVYRDMKTGKWPVPVKCGARKNCFYMSQIEAVRTAKFAVRNEIGSTLQVVSETVSNHANA